jgi:Domain of unknown function (DUF1931)
MPVMGLVKFERFFQAAGGVDVDRNDMKRYLEFVNRTIYDLLVIGQAHAESNGRDLIEPSDQTITAGLQETISEFRKLDEGIELRPIVDYIAARPPLCAVMSDDTQQGLPEIFGGISVALARTLKILDPSAQRPARRVGSGLPHIRPAHLTRAQLSGRQGVLRLGACGPDVLAQPVAERDELAPGLPDEVQRGTSVHGWSSGPFPGGRQRPVPQQVQSRVIRGYTAWPGLQLITADGHAVLLEAGDDLRQG